MILYWVGKLEMPFCEQSTRQHKPFSLQYAYSSRVIDFISLYYKQVCVCQKGKNNPPNKLYFVSVPRYNFTT